MAENEASNNAVELPPRSPFLLNRHASVLMVIDVQQKLMPLILDHRRLTWNLGRIIQGARAVQVPIFATEQYPQGLGPTIPELIEVLPGPFAEKKMFSCRECSEITRPWHDGQLSQIVVVGIETHVCIQQSALDLLSQGFQVFVPVDAVGARHDIDHRTALRRIESCGGVLTTVESVLFEWCETAASTAFKEISRLVRSQPP